MRLSDIDQLDLWRGEAIVERQVRLHAVAVAGGAALEGGLSVAMEKERTPEEKRLSETWAGAEVAVDHGPWREQSDRKVRTSRTRLKWQGARPAKP